MIDFYCVHKEGDERTKSALDDAVESGKQFNINVIPHPGVYSNIENLLAQENLVIHKQGAKKIRSRGVIGCFLSHYFLWKKCVEMDTPIGIMEYDGIFIRGLPNNILDQFEDYLHLDHTRHTHLSKGNKDYTNQIEAEVGSVFKIKQLEENFKAKGINQIKYINNNHIRGTYGYIIKPSGAKKLIKGAKQNGVLPSDVSINLAYCNIYYTKPSVIMLNPKGLDNRYGGSHTNHDVTF
jgi:GR25 family glycosyltransferase involved in LPS biosynthesis